MTSGELDEADRHLQAVLAWSAIAPPRLSRLTTSLLLHLALIAWLWIPAAPDSAAERPSRARDAAVPIFAPPRSAPAPAPVETRVPVPSLNRIEVPQQAAAQPEIQVDLNAMELSFDADISNQLPEVVRQQHGMLGLLDKADPGIAHYLFRPPSWELGDREIDVSARLRITMEPSRQWAVFRSLGDRYGLALERYNASAVFDIGYRRCLLESIRRRSVGMKQPEVASYVSAVRLAFNAAAPCGVDVLEVSFAVIPAAQP